MAGGKNCRIEKSAGDNPKTVRQRSVVFFVGGKHSAGGFESTGTSTRGLNDSSMIYNSRTKKPATASGLSRPAVSNLLRLLSLAEAVQKMLEDGRLEMGHARALLALAKPAQAVAAKKIIAGKLNTRRRKRW